MGSVVATAGWAATRTTSIDYSTATFPFAGCFSFAGGITAAIAVGRARLNSSKRSTGRPEAL